MIIDKAVLAAGNVLKSAGRAEEAKASYEAALALAKARQKKSVGGSRHGPKQRCTGWSRGRLLRSRSPLITLGLATVQAAATARAHAAFTTTGRQIRPLRLSMGVDMGISPGSCAGTTKLQTMITIQKQKQ